MNLALEHFGDNPIIDELVFWPPKSHRIVSLRAASAMFRKPFIEVEFANGEVIRRHFARASFADYWAEARVILGTLTGIELISDLSCRPLADPEEMRRQVLAIRDDCIVESNKMYDQGMYAQFLMQYGEDCKDLPPASLQKLAHARRRLGLPG